MHISSLDHVVDRAPGADTRGLMSSWRKDWRTPEWIAKSVDRVLDGIDLDPCGSSVPPQTVPAKRIICPPEDGLAIMWPLGTVFMNPPYGQEIRRWVIKYNKAWNIRSTISGIALVAARTDTQWWKSLTHEATMLAFIHGRIRFDDRPEGAATFPSVLVLHTHDFDVSERFVNEFRKVSSIYVPVGRK